MSSTHSPRLRPHSSETSLDKVVHKKKNLFKGDHTLAKIAVTQLKDKVVVSDKISHKSVPKYIFFRKSAP